MSVLPGKRLAFRVRSSRLRRCEFMFMFGRFQNRSLKHEAMKHLRSRHFARVSREVGDLVTRSRAAVDELIDGLSHLLLLSLWSQ
jgi:hypothetical protein